MPSIASSSISSDLTRVYFGGDMREPRLAITLLPIASSSFYALAVIVPVVPLLVALQESEPASPFGRGPLIVLVKE